MKTTLLPDKIILDSLIRKPYKLEMPIHGGLDTEIVIILDFKVKSENGVWVSLTFNEDITSFIGINFLTKSMNKYEYYVFVDEFEEKEQKEELSVLKQAIELLKNDDDLIIFCRTMEKYIAF